MMVLSICDLPDVLKVMRIVMIVINIIKIVVPILLILSLLIKFVRAVISSDNDMLAKAKKSAVSSIIAAVLVFFIPTFVDVIAKIVSPDGDYSNCLKDISVETINQAHYRIEDSLLAKFEETLDINNYYLAENYLSNIDDLEKKTYYENKINDTRIKKARELIKIANESLDTNDYKVAKYFIESLKNNDTKKTIIKELEDVKTKIDESKIQANNQNNSNTNYNSNDSSNNEIIRNPNLVENPMTKYVSVDEMNKLIASTVKSRGFYTRSAVVGVATTVINHLKNNYNYAIPYLLGGRYSTPGEWGVNPKWGTKIIKDNEEKISGLDCRNFVIWVFKQAGLSLNRGYGLEGSITKDYDNKYPNISDAKPGDVIDALKHLMLVVGKDDTGYMIAESSGRVKIQHYTFEQLKNEGYDAYNMDGVYNNTAMSCKLVNTYRPYSGACRIPRSEFPSYYN